MTVETGVFDQHFNVKSLVDIIDWQWLFPPFGIKGKFPDIMDDDIKGPEARKLLREAKEFLYEYSHSFHLTQKMGLFEIKTEGHCAIFNTPFGKEFCFPFFRQQEAKRDKHFSYIDCFTKESPHNLLGLFSSTVRFKAPYNWDKEDHFVSILTEILCGRLAEAGTLAMEKPFLEKAQAKTCIRPAPGYKALPDHTLKKIIIDSLGGEGECQIKLTEDYMMDPPASATGIVIFDSDAGYPPLEYIGNDQLEYYAKNRGIEAQKLKSFLNLIVVD